MYIEFKRKRLKRQCEKFEEGSRAWGKDNAKRVFLRIGQMQAMPSLADLMKFKPARCHPLKGKRKGQYAVDVIHPFRLIFEPITEAGKKRKKGIIDEAKIKIIRILEVVDYHD